MLICSFLPLFLPFNNVLNWNNNTSYDYNNIYNEQMINLLQNSLTNEFRTPGSIMSANLLSALWCPQILFLPLNHLNILQCCLLHYLKVNFVPLWFWTSTTFEPSKTSRGKNFKRDENKSLQNQKPRIAKTHW